MEEPQISVVIPTKDRPQLVCRALKSVLAQTVNDYEIIVVIDGKDLKTEYGIRELNNSKIRVVVNDFSVGGAEARNIGVRHSRGKWVAFLDDDDEWVANKLELQYSQATASSFAYPVIYCRVIARSPLQDYVWPRRGIHQGEHISEYLFVRNSLSQGEGLIQTTMMMAPKQLLLRLPFRKGLKRHQEWDWLLRAVRLDGVGFEYCPEILAVWYIEESRLSVSKISDWRISLEWARLNKSYFTPNAYSSFMLLVAGNMVVKQLNLLGTLKILKEAFIVGNPRIYDMFLFLGICCLPTSLRRRLGRIRQNREEAR